ncbi:MAG TPA: Ig-like domain-containing protein [Kofleriaceae bacterium]|nr:Ig-like domain-containing protein [Kofleriaceae bacterium]
MIRLGAILGAGALALACSDDESSTELHPEGPPMVQQVFVQEKVISDTATREKFQLAFGDHPEIPLPDEDSVNGDDREVVNAVARGTAKLRVVFDEILVGNYLEEIACADGSYSPVPIGADPDDIKDCSGPDLSRCVAVCIGDSGPVGILDENEDGASDETRMRDYGGGELGVSVMCGDQMMPLDREASYYNPSGNQLLPAVPPPQNINGLGPALVLIPLDGMKTGAACTLTFRADVKDKDGENVCAPPDGNIEAGCTPGDTSLISFNVEPLSLFSSAPEDEETEVALTDPGSPDATILLQFNAAIDPDTVAAITLTDMMGDPVPISATVSADDAAIVTVTVEGGYQADTQYTITVGTGLTDKFGGALPAEITVSFTTEMAGA